MSFGDQHEETMKCESGSRHGIEISLRSRKRVLSGQSLAHRLDTLGSQTRARRKEAVIGGSLLVPSAAVFAVFVFWPLARTISSATHKTDPFGGNRRYVGLAQITEVLGSDSFANSLGVTLRFALLTVPTGLFLGVGLAVLANRRLRGMAFFQTIFSSTVATSVAVASVLFLTLLNPQIGMLTRVFGWGSEVPVLQDPRWALLAVASATVWQNLGFTFIVILAALQAVPDELIDAAKVDGANGWMRLVQVVIPQLRRALGFVVVVLTITSFQAFGQIDLLTEGGPGESTNVLVYSLYRTAFGAAADPGRAAVQALALFVIVMVLTIAQLAFLERGADEQVQAI